MSLTDSVEWQNFKASVDATLSRIESEISNLATIEAQIMTELGVIAAGQQHPAAGVARVQGKSHQNGGSSSTTVAVTLDQAVGSGNMLCVSIGTALGTLTSFSVTDDKGNTYTSVDVTDITGPYTWGSAYILNVTNGPTTVTATVDVSGTPTSAAFSSIVVEEFSGVAGPLDVHAIHTQAFPPGTGTDAVTSGSVTTNHGGELVYGATVNVSSAGTIEAGTGFSAGYSVPDAFQTEYQTQVSAGPVAATFTAGNGGDSFISYVMCFEVP
jgi:hypothetical protein